jgi:hypothetical protein
MSPSVNTIGFPSGLTSKPGFMWTQVTAPDRFAPTALRVGYPGLRQVARVTVKPGDLVYGGERAEVATLQDANGVQIVETPGTTQFFAWSDLVPTDWRSPQPRSDGAVWGIIFQVHHPDDWIGSPPVAFNLTDRFSLTLNAGNLDVNPWPTKNFEFSDGSLNAGRWTDWVLGVTFAEDATGAVQVWRRNEGAANLAKVLDISGVVTLSTKPSAPTKKQSYIKRGLYRSPSRDVTNTYYTTGLVRAPDFQSAVLAAFGG